MKQMAYLSESDSDTDNLEMKFRGLLKEFCSFATQFGYNIEPYREGTWVKFRTLPTAVQKDCFNRFSTYYNLCMMAAKSDISFNDDRSLAWWAMKEYGFRPSSDFFDKLEKEDLLEIYNAQGIQIYRNWAFFQVSGYSMGDLFVFPWNELYIRDQEINDSLFAHASRGLAADCRSTFMCSVPRHLCVEALSPSQNICDVQMKFIAPLFDKSDSPVAFVITSFTEKVGQKINPTPTTPAPTLSLG
ncbi:MAG: hypothetical protein V4736_04705 [Bdellovibrionota bacterium]